MATFRFSWRAAFIAVLVLVLATVGMTQDGVSTAGFARTRYLGTVGVLPPSRDVSVEDFVNYPRHEIARPKAGESVALDVRWGQGEVSANREAVLQIGLSTALAHDRSELAPLNLVLVIDKSGSMAEDNKMVRVKESLGKLVSQLRSSDVLSIVTFDSEASVLLPATAVTNKESIQGLVRGIEPGSATNLNDGLMLGYKEATKHFKVGATNRVILLTDGIANRGMTDSNEIAKASAAFNDKGIDLCTIGVGSDVNQDFLHDLAKSGRGLFHFVANSEDIDKVFVQDLQSQVSLVASEPSLTIKTADGLLLDKVYGYGPQVGNHLVKLKLENMNGGMTEAVLARFKITDSKEDRDRYPVTVNLTYWDSVRKKQINLEQSATIVRTSKDSGAKLEDGSVAKNYCIAQMAQAIHDMAVDCEQNKFSAAQKLIGEAIAETKRDYPNLEDADIKRTLQIAVKYLDILRQRNASEDSDTSAPPAGSNLIVNGDFSQGNSHFLSGIGDYVPPTPNCLWSGPYTIAPSFNSPSLHDLVGPGTFSAPSGHGQVLFANVGGMGAMVLWNQVVICMPNTRYMIRFQGISLSGSDWANSREVPTQDWVPTVRIRAGGSESSPQAIGCGRYGEVRMSWFSGTNTSVAISFVRVPMEHRGGIIGIADIEMTPISPGLRE